MVTSGDDRGSVTLRRSWHVIEAGAEIPSAAGSLPPLAVDFASGYLGGSLYSVSRSVMNAAKLGAMVFPSGHARAEARA
jgi:hypothetical protein